MRILSIPSWNATAEIIILKDGGEGESGIPIFARRLKRPSLSLSPPSFFKSVRKAPSSKAPLSGRDSLHFAFAANGAAFII